MCLLSKLIYLDFSHGNLSSIPNCLKKLKKVEEFKIAENKLTEFPLEIIMGMENLIILDIDAMEMPEIPEKIKDHPHLEAIFFSEELVTNNPLNIELGVKFPWKA